MIKLEKHGHSNPPIYDEIFQAYFDRMIQLKVLHGIVYWERSVSGKFEGKPHFLRSTDKLPSTFTVKNANNILYRIMNRKERRSNKS